MSCDTLSDLMDTYSCTLKLDAPPTSVYSALSTHAGLTGWWTEDCEIDPTPGGQATFRFGKTHKTFRIESLTPGQKVVWVCTDQYHHLPGLLKKTDEWVGTTINFSLSPVGDKATELTFIHEGLTPDLECYGICVAGWDHFLGNSLKQYVETGKGDPFNNRYPYSD